MKIGRGGKSGGGPGLSRSDKGKGKTTDSGTKVEFSAAVAEAQQVERERDLAELISEIETQAANLVKRRADGELNKYRDLITRFMKRVVSESYQMTEVPSAFFMENSKVFVVARRVEEKLLQLAEQIHDKTVDATQIAATTSEIRGLLLDMEI